MSRPEHMPAVVLIADDDELTRSLMAAALAEKGFEPYEVNNGQEVLAAFARLQPDLVILDVDMPVMDGFTACRRIRASERDTETPVVIVTGNEDTGSIDRAYDIGATFKTWSHLHASATCCADRFVLDLASSYCSNRRGYQLGTI